MNQDSAIWLTSATILFLIGIYGLSTKKNGIKMLISIEILVCSANMVLIGSGYLFSTQSNSIYQSFVLLSLSVGGAIVGLGLTILMLRFQQLGNVDVSSDILLKG